MACRNGLKRRRVKHLLFGFYNHVFIDPWNDDQIQVMPVPVIVVVST